jgi:hypothetical protein
MLAMSVFCSQRRLIAFALTLFFLCATYFTSLPITLHHAWDDAAPTTNNNHHDVADGIPLDTTALTPTPTAISPAGAQTTQTDVGDSHGPAATEVIMDEFDETPIRELCNQTSWVSSSDVVINCGGRVGGVGNYPP